MVSCDADDPSMNNAAMRDWVADLPADMVLRFGVRANKIDAINRDMSTLVLDWDLLLVASDDMVPNDFGYDDAIREEFTLGGSDNLLWINDGKQGKFCTIPCMDKAYYLRDQFIYDPRYISLFADNAQTEIAQKRGRLLKTGNLITNHSPDWGGANVRDGLYSFNNKFYNQDRRTYNNHRKEYA